MSNANVVFLAQRQDQIGTFARGRLRLDIVSAALLGDYDQEEAAEYWRRSAELADEIAGLAPTVADRVRELADKLRGVAAAIEEADL